ncbi:MAG TPA: hypothetical protein DF296_03550 [Candidatus Margulisbacteria bacterium]|nr:hypothetical protein [Candidatus Margulisiibacteriota bacterium]
MFFKIIMEDVEKTYKLKSEITSGIFKGIKSNYNVLTATKESVQGTEVIVALGDMVRMNNIDAWVVPHFENTVSTESVAAGVLKGARKTHWEQNAIEQHWNTVVTPLIADNAFGDALVTMSPWDRGVLTRNEFDRLGDKAGQVWEVLVKEKIIEGFGKEDDEKAGITSRFSGKFEDVEGVAGLSSLNVSPSVVYDILMKNYMSQPKAFVHVSTAHCPDENAFDITKKATYNALKKADAAGLTSIAMPAINTGPGRRLTSGESAKAMYEAIEQYLQENSGKNRNLKHIAVVVYLKYDKKTKQMLSATQGQEQTYGVAAYNVFVQSLAKQFIHLKSKQEFYPEYIAVRRMISDFIEQQSNKELTEEQKLDITEQVVRSRKFPGQVKDEKVVREILADIGYTYEDKDFVRKLEAFGKLHLKELQDQIEELDTNIQKQNKKIRALKDTYEPEELEEPYIKERFKELEDKIGKIQTYKQDCDYLLECYSKILKVTVDAKAIEEMNDLQKKYDLAIKELKAAQLKSGSTENELNRAERKVSNLEQKNQTLENEIAKLKSVNKSSGYQAASSRSSWG